MAATTVENRIYTAEELFEIGSAGERYELIRGHLRERPLEGLLHGACAGRFAGFFGHYVLERDLGRIANVIGIILERNPDTVVAPDLAFVTRERLPERFSSFFSVIVPDLVIEVTSPNDDWAKMTERILLWLDSGVRLVWIAEPESRTLTIHRSLQDIQILRGQDTLEAEEVAPGFSLPVSQFFP